MPDNPVLTRCKKPTQVYGQVFACGKCLPCTIKRRKEWAHRIQLESSLRTDNCYMTLSYTDKDLPWAISTVPTPTLDTCGLSYVATLEPDDLKNFMKRFRKRIEPLEIRFYAVGEYGAKTLRPHYHLVVFGFPTCVRGRTRRRPGSTRPSWSECCPTCRLVGESWGKGDIDLGLVEDASANYVARYVTKKMTRLDDPRLHGRFPEFSRQSNRKGGLGIGMMKFVAEELKRYGVDKTQSDVPVTLRHGAKMKPLGRYLRRKLRKELGREENAPQETLDAYQERLRPMQLLARSRPQSLSQVVAEENKGAVDQLEARERIFRQKDKL